MTLNQLTLSIGLRDDATFANYFPGKNQALLECLQDFIHGKCEPFIYLWGEQGVGRSHLLQACCHVCQQDAWQAMYLPLTDYQNLSPSVLMGMESLSLVEIDDLDSVLNLSRWEEALFHFYNRARDNGTRLIIAANQAPLQLNCQLADLRSRLGAGLIFKVQALDDYEKLAALCLRAERRGMYLSPEVGRYVLHHYTRSMPDLTAVLDKLDEASLTAKRRLTIPFVKAVLAG